MGALVRGRNANRLRAIIPADVATPGIMRVIDLYDEGQTEHEDDSWSWDAFDRLPEDEQKRFLAFLTSCSLGTVDDAERLIALAEAADELPFAYDPDSSLSDRFNNLLMDILGDLGLQAQQIAANKLKQPDA